MSADLQIRIGAELTEIKGALATLRRDLAGVGDAANKAGAKKAFGGVESGASSAITQVKGLIAAFAALGGAIALIRQADELTTLNARIRLVTASAEEFAAVQVRLFDLAQSSRASLSATIDLYTRVAQSTKDAGVGQETLLSVVETINQAVQLSGASAQAAEAALVQLGQGLGSGTLRGEELNSVLEQTPALADAIAKGMGITRAELRKYGEEGKITSKAVIDALLAQKNAVADQFQSLPLTVGQATTQLGNSLQQLLGVFNETTGATGGLADVISDFAEYLSSDEVIGSVVEFAATWGNSLKLIVQDFKDAIDFIKDATKDFAGTGEDAVSLFLRAFRELPLNLRTIVKIAAAILRGMVDSFLADAQLLKEAFAAIFTDDTIEAAINRRNERIRASLAATKAAIDQAVAEREKAIADAKAAASRAQAGRETARGATLSNSRGTFKAQQSDKEKNAAAALRKAQLDAEEKLVNDAAKRELEAKKQLFEDLKISAAEYFRERERLELESIDRQIAIERERVKAGGADAIKANAEIEILERERTRIKNEAARDAAAYQRQLDEQLTDARAQDLENQGRTAEAANLRLRSQYRDLLKKLGDDSEGAKLIEKLIGAGTAKARFDQLKAEFDRVLADLQAKVQGIANQRLTGSLGGDAAVAQTRDAQAAAMERLRALQAEMQALATDNQGLPAITQGANEASQAIDRLALESATGLEGAIINLRASLDNLQQGFAQSAVGAGVDALAGLFDDLITGTKSADEALKDFVVGFVRSMAQIASRALATFLVLQLLDAIYPGLGKATVATMSVGAGVNHTGGIVGRGGTVRRVDPLVFAGAPRYHSGGMVGLKPDERPAILQTGEEVLSRTDPRNRANGGGQQQSGGGYRIVNVIDPSMVEGFLQSSAGERTVLNVISRNGGQVRQMIGK